jgi:hypothetical protein
MDESHFRIIGFWVKLTTKTPHQDGRRFNWRKTHDSDGNRHGKAKISPHPQNRNHRGQKLGYPLTDDDAVQGVEKNISVGGVCFAVPHAYEPGDLLTLSG